MFNVQCSMRDFFYCLEVESDFDCWIFRNYHCFKISKNSLTDDHYYFLDTEGESIFESEFEEDFSVGSDRIDLFETAVSAS